MPIRQVPSHSWVSSSITSRTAAWYDSFVRGADFSCACVVRPKAFRASDFPGAPALPKELRLPMRLIRETWQGPGSRITTPDPNGISARVELDTTELSRALGGGPAKVRMSGAAGYWRVGEHYRAEGEERGVRIKISFDIGDHGEVGIREIAAFQVTPNGEAARWLAQLMSKGALFDPGVVVGKLHEQ